MSRAITVKVATPKVIKALETKLEAIKKSYSEQSANEAKYKQTYENWSKEIGKWAIDNFSKAENIRTNYRSYNKTLNIDFDIMAGETDFPAEPVKDYEEIGGWQYKEMVEEITNALSILRMTDEETVNASTMKQIARYL
jgi:hypothetical protein